MENKIIVKSLNKANWARRPRYNKCHDHIVARISRKGYATGLTTKKQIELEKDLGYDKGELSSHSEFWKKYAITMTERPLTLDLENPQDQLDYELIKQSPRVANSINELANWPKAEYVVFNQEEEALNENKTIDAEARAIHKFMELDANEKRSYLKLLGKAASNMSDPVVRNVLFKIAKNEPTAFNKISDMEDYASRLLVYDLISNKIIQVKGGHYTYNDLSLGHGEEKAARFLEDPHNQELKIALKAKLSEIKTK